MMDRLFFITLLCVASTEDKKGTIPKCKEAEIIRLMYLPENAPAVDGTLKRLRDNEMITIDNDGSVIICNFMKRQGQNLSGYERIKKYREKRKKVSNKPSSPVIIDNVHDNANDNARIDKNRIDKNRIPTTVAKAPVDDISSFINLFQEINPSYSQLFKRPPQRAAADRLLKLHDFAWWQRFFLAYNLAIQDRFCPKAMTPIQLEESLGRIIAFGQARKQGNKYQVDVV